jgi:thiosulfate/3-mercaptopyruvate sulfurtransferase
LPVHAQPVALVDDLPDGARVIDIRAEDACTSATLPGARCVPAEVLFGPDGGAPVSFHALRWLLGTVGLSGAETVAVFAGNETRAGAVAALLHLAGQRDVVVYTGGADLSARGESRSFSRETIFTAAMRTEAMRIDTPAPPLVQQLTAFARGAAETVAFAPDA